jgi:hypothetical protein
MIKRVREFKSNSSNNKRRNNHYISILFVGLLAFFYLNDSRIVSISRSILLTNGSLNLIAILLLLYNTYTLIYIYMYAQKKHMIVI